MGKKKGKRKSKRTEEKLTELKQRIIPQEEVPYLIAAIMQALQAAVQGHTILSSVGPLTINKGFLELAEEIGPIDAIKHLIRVHNDQVTFKKEMFS